MAYIHDKKDGAPEVDFPHPGYVPAQPVIWPGPTQRANQIQQTKVAAKPQQNFTLPTTQPNLSMVQPRTVPQMVSNVRVVSSAAKDGQKTIRVQFTHPGNDPYFAGARVYLRQGGSKQPVLVAGGAASPLSFTVPVNGAPHVLHVSSYGNWGETDILKSPSAHVRLV